VAEEAEVARVLLPLAKRGVPVVLHPDTISDFAVWREFGRALLVENMDPRKTGRDVAELGEVFEKLPDASLCLDLAHVRRCDTSMVEAYRLLTTFGDRLAQLHISELDSECRHRPISPGAIRAYREIAGMIAPDVPVIIESPVAREEIHRELAAVREALGWRPAPRRMKLARGMRRAAFVLGAVFRHRRRGS
jgi:hypothetical protein